MKNLIVIEINREIIGPSIEELLPTFKKFKDTSRFLFLGDMVHQIKLKREIRFVLENLSPKSLCLHFVTKDVEEGIALMNLMRKILRNCA